MTIPLPRLDDRRFEDLVHDALERAKVTAPDWTDHSPGDPGVTLVELFAFLTEALLYRLNRVPPKLQLALLNLAGVNLRPPTAAVATLTFKRAQGASADAAITIPGGSRIASADGSVSFLLPASVTLKAGKNKVEATALHCELVEGELLGSASGIAGQTLRVAKAPIIGATPDGLDFMLGVEVEPESATGRALRTADSRTFSLWREVDDFRETAAGDTVYTLDRGTGTIQFGSGEAGALPASGRQFRAWYRRGGGRAGNVAAGVLTVIRDGPQGIEVTNADRAAGGSDGETIEALIKRAPAAISSLRVAVTTRDYEQVVLDVGGIARAQAFAQAQAWRHAEPGVVEVTAVPAIDADALPDGAITAKVVQDHRVEALRQRAADALDKRRPLGVRALVSWTQVRPVSVSARIVIGPEADPATIERGVRRRINALFSPLRDLPFGRQLRASEVYERILNEPGVRYADQLTFTIAETPASDVQDLARDPVQPGAWFAVTKVGAYRTLDDGESWSSILVPSEGEPRFLRRHPGRPGVMMIGIALGSSSAVRISYNLGETWSEPVATFNSELFDAAWIERDGKPMLLLATAEGLRQFAPGSGTGPAPVIVDKAIDTRGFYAVTASTSPSGVIAVAVAARQDGGVYLSSQGGVSETFQPLGLKNKDVRQLSVQSFAARTWLWATASSEAGEEGEGAFRLELRASGEKDPEGFKPFNIGWKGGSCEGLAFAGPWVFAGSNRAGVLRLDTTAAKPAWTPVRLDGGLPIRDTERLLEVVTAVAATPGTGGRPPIVLSGGVRGVHRSLDGGMTFSLTSATVFTDRVPLPARWLYCAGEHSLTIVDDVEGRG